MIKRSWFVKAGSQVEEDAKEITQDRAKRELANAHGDKALEKLEYEMELRTRFGVYRWED